MGLTCLHSWMTVKKMKDQGFNEAAAKFAGSSNAAVDDKQGNTSKESNLHAMCGLGQSDNDCRSAVAKIIADGKKESADRVAAEQYKLALQCMGETLHTIQDLAFHKYEPWPYAGIGDAILNNPNYMFCHAVRDLGVVSVTNVVDVDVSWRVANQVYVGVRGFYHPSNNYFAPLPPIGGQPPEIAGFGGLFTITIGGAPGSVRVPNPYPDSRGAIGGPYSSMMSSGRADLTRAEDDTENFIRTIQKDVESRPAVGTHPAGTDLWQSFLGFRPG